MTKKRVVHYINQFYAQIGGEECADQKPLVREGPVGPGLALQQGLGDTAEIVATVICGDSYFADNSESATEQVMGLISAAQPDLVIAGPAFNAGRYGLACGAVCDAAARRLKIPVLTGMYPENPGAEMYHHSVYIVETGISAASMRRAVPRMVSLAGKLLSGAAIGFPEEEGYIPQGYRVNVRTEKNGAERGVEMLLKKLKGEPFETELPMPTFDRVPPAPALHDIRHAKIAIVTSGGIVPAGNPDHIESANASRYGTYSIKGLNDLRGGGFITVHGGYDPVYALDDPDRVVPLDALREIEREGGIGSLYDYYYATVGNTTAVSNAKKYGEDIADDMLRNGVQAAILTSN